MTCIPGPGCEGERWHWLVHARGESVCMRWSEGWWGNAFGSELISPAMLWNNGWCWHSVARPLAPFDRRVEATLTAFVDNVAKQEAANDGYSNYREAMKIAIRAADAVEPIAQREER